MAKFDLLLGRDGRGGRTMAWTQPMVLGLKNYTSQSLTNGGGLFFFASGFYSYEETQCNNEKLCMALCF